VPTQQQVLDALAGGTDYAAAARRLGIHPGLAYLVATGVPADGSDVLTGEEQDRPGMLPGSTQHLANPPASKPSPADVVHDWLRRRAQADPQMVAATRARTAPPGPVRDPQGSTDLPTVLTRQHDAVTSLVKQLAAIPGRSTGGTPAQASQRNSIVDLVRRAVAPHAASESEVLWPAVRRALPDGDDWADRGTDLGEQVARTLRELAGEDCTTEGFDQHVEQLTSLLHRHGALADRVLLLLREALPDDELDRLGGQVLAAQQAVPQDPGPRPADRAGHPGPTSEEG
jgi:Hemerythrin HHE cation binding domain